MVEKYFEKRSQSRKNDRICLFLIETSPITGYFKIGAMQIRFSWGDR
jgi:hypothetical protein